MADRTLHEWLTDDKMVTDFFGKTVPNEIVPKIVAPWVENKATPTFSQDGSRVPVKGLKDYLEPVLPDRNAPVPQTAAQAISAAQPSGGRVDTVPGPGPITMMLMKLFDRRGKGSEPAPKTAEQVVPDEDLRKLWPAATENNAPFGRMFLNRDLPAPETVKQVVPVPQTAEQAISAAQPRLSLKSGGRLDPVPAPQTAASALRKLWDDLPVLTENPLQHRGGPATNGRPKPAPQPAPLTKEQKELIAQFPVARIQDNKPEPRKELRFAKPPETPEEKNKKKVAALLGALKNTPVKQALPIIEKLYTPKEAPDYQNTAAGKYLDVISQNLASRIAAADGDPVKTATAKLEAQDALKELALGGRSDILQQLIPQLRQNQ